MDKVYHTPCPLGVGVKFSALVCHVCKVSPSFKPEVKISRCSRCHWVGYCSVEHQKQNWAEHKKYCKVLRSLHDIHDSEKDGELWPRPGDNAKWLEWKKAQLTVAMRLLAKTDGRIKALVQELIIHQRGCVHCFQRDSLTPCAKCGIVAWCSDACEKAVSDAHERVCRPLATAAALEAMVAHDEEKSPPVWIPELCVSEYTPLPLDTETDSAWSQYFKARHAPDFYDLARIGLTLALSVPVSCVYAADKVFQALNAPPLSSRQSLCIHLVGAAVYPESWAMTKYEEILHLVPSLEELTVVLVGPEAGKRTDGTLSQTNCELCPGCAEKGRNLIRPTRPMLYHNYLDEASRNNEAHIKADIIFAFDSGLHEFSGAAGDTWEQSLVRVKDAGVPFVYTAFDEHELSLDTRVLERVGMTKVLVEAHRNPYRSQWPHLDVNPNGYYQLNQYMSAVSGSS